jgi:hypothetical protein
MSLVIKFYFTSSMLNMFRTLIHPSPGTWDFFYCITILVVCSCFDVCWSFGVAGLEWYPCNRLNQCFSLLHLSKQEHTTNVVIQ